MQKFSIESIGTHLEIQIDTIESCDEDFLFIHKKLSAFEKKFSRFISDNWLHKLNKKGEGTLDEDGYAMMMFALEMAEKTGGYFDPTVGSVLARLGYGPENERKNSHTVSYKNITIQGEKITLANNVMIEFGGVGKGYLLDVLRKILEKYERFLINFGGDIFGKGGWTIGLENPHNTEEAIGTIILDNNFLACSSGSKRKWGKHHHLINPYSQTSSQDVLATYIESATGIVADAYATALCVMDFEKSTTLLENTDEIEGIIIAGDGRCFQSKKSRAILFRD